MISYPRRLVSTAGAAADSDAMPALVSNKIKVENPVVDLDGDEMTR